ncbi:MAG: hypothetical protein IPM34_11785 [Saprospiraceae bacterium]|nr:hypothetical protein [Saprospiraceae bacterium]
MELIKILTGNICLARLFPIIFSICNASAQKTAVLFPEFHYVMGIPGADLSNRYGPHLGIGAGLNYQPKSELLNFAIRYSLIFGSDVREDVLKPFRTDFEGLLIGFDELLSEMKLRERAWLIQAATGGLIPLSEKTTKRLSLKWQLGFGFFEHKIRFVDDASSLPQFNSSLVKGLDRLSNGFALIPSLGYESLSNRGKFSYYAGIESIFGFTKNQRSYHYDLGISELGKSRLDLMIQMKLAIYLPFYPQSSSELIEY